MRVDLDSPRLFQGEGARLSAAHGLVQGTEGALPGAVQDQAAGTQNLVVSSRQKWQEPPAEDHPAEVLQR